MEDEEKIGLFQLWPSEDVSDNTTLDIVAIHGLGGHPLKTWMEEDRLWLRDFLPTSIPKARILTYGYDSGVAFGSSASNITDFARDLLERIRAKRRRTTQERPIIFVCHSMGGIVLKKTLIMAHERESRYGALLQATSGVIFMGTPHRGADIAYWGKVLGKLANLPLMGSIRTELLKELQPKSVTLGEICSQFVERGSKLQIYSFYERVKTAGLNDLVVDDQSAILHLPNETPLPMEADHRGLCKFLTANSQKYLLVLDSLEELVDGSRADPQGTLSEEQSHFLRTIKPPIDVNALTQIPRPYTGTCQWILHHEAYLSWKQSKTRHLLFFSGAPGSGKSVMTRFIVEYLSKEVNHESKINQLFCLERSISYVFCSDKDSRHTDSSAVVHSILYQTLLRHPRLLRCIPQEYLRSPQAFAANSEVAWECLSAILQHGRNLQFLFVIDALDELPDEARMALILGMQKLVIGDLIGRLKVIITDRRDSSLLLDPKFPLESMIVDLDSELVVRQDVKTYLEAAVRTFCEEHEFPEPVLEKVRTELIARSNGLFLLASLHFTAFCHGVSYWTPDTVSQKLGEIQQVPATVESLYCQLLKSVPLQFQSSLRTIFTWVLAAREPLKVADLKYAVSIKPEHQSYEDVDKCIGFNFAAVLRRFCGAFLKITECEEIQFRHQSFKDLLLNGCSLQANDSIFGRYKTTFEEREYTVSSQALHLLHWKEFASSVQIHEIVISKATGKSQPGFPDRPLLWYCCRNWPQHYGHVQNNPKLAAIVAKYVSSTQGNYFRSLGVSMPPAIQRKYGVDLTFRKSTPPLSLLCHYGDFPSVAEHLVLSSQNLNQADSLGMSPLHWALALGRSAIGSLLMTLPRIAINCESSNGDRPIHASMYNHSNFAVFQAFLKDQRVDVNSKGANDQTALHWIVTELSTLETWLDPLLERRDLDLNPRDKSGITPFIQALSKGNGRQVAFRLLQQTPSKLDVTVCDKNGTNALSLASMRGWTDVRRIIQGRDKSQAFSIADDGMNALTRSAFWGQKQMLETLIRDSSKRDVCHLANQGRFNLLSLCAQQDWEDIIMDLHTKYELECLDQDDQGRTLLHWAAASGWSYSYAPHSLQQKARFNIQDRDGKTALHLAVEARNFKAVKSLLVQGADVFTKDKHGNNPVHAAADWGAKAILLEFLKTSHREFGRDNKGRSLLHFISTWEWPDVLKEYVRTKRPIIDVLDHKRHTPLQYAAIYGNQAILEALIQYGVVIDRIDSSGLTALHHAIQQNHISIARILVYSGADTKKLDGFRRSCFDLSLRTGGDDMIRFISALGTDLSTKYQSGVRVHDRTKDMEKEQYKTAVSVSMASRGEDKMTAPAAERDEIKERISQVTTPLVNNSLTENKWIDCFDVDYLSADYFEARITARSKKRLRITDMLFRLLIEQGLHFQDLDGIELDSEDQSPGLDACHSMSKSDSAIESSVPKQKQIESLDATEFLQLAAEQGEKRLLRVLIQQGFPPNGTCRHGWTALHQASSQNQLEALQLLLEVGSDTEVAQADSRLTALHIAAISGDTDIVRTLLKHGADLNKIDVHGWTALHHAVAKSHYLLVQLILEQDADAIRAAEGHTSLLVLCLKNERLCQLLLEYGADPDGREGDPSPLEMASSCGLRDVCLLLYRYSKNPITSMLRVMVKGAGHSFSTLLPLYLDWSEGLLSDFGPFTYNSLEQSLLYHLFQKRWFKISDLEEKQILRLCARGSDPNFTDGGYYSPMHFATNYPDILITLFTKGGKLNVVTRKGTTLLHAAVVYRKERSVEILLQKGADPNAKNNFGETPLHLVFGCRLERSFYEKPGDKETLGILKLLLEYGADPSIQYLRHKVFGVVVPETAMDLAKRVLDLDMISVLEEHAKQHVLPRWKYEMVEPRKNSLPHLTIRPLKSLRQRRISADQDSTTKDHKRKAIGEGSSRGQTALSGN